jgi:hypothetical protein
MTRFAPPAVYKCPSCGTLLTWARLASFRPMGAGTKWSDGGEQESALVDMCLVIGCPGCSTILWREECDSVGTLLRKPPEVGPLARLIARWNGDKHGHLTAEQTWRDVPVDWKAAERGRLLRDLSVDSKMKHARILSPTRELFLRRHIWWLSNDHERVLDDGTRSRQEPAMFNIAREENMMRLLELLEVTDDAPMHRVELLRMLGRFDESIALLKYTANSIGRLVGKKLDIEAWASAGDTSLKVMFVHALHRGRLDD